MTRPLLSDRYTSPLNTHAKQVALRLHSVVVRCSAVDVTVSKGVAKQSKICKQRQEHTAHVVFAYLEVSPFSALNLQVQVN